MSIGSAQAAPLALVEAATPASPEDASERVIVFRTQGAMTDLWQCHAPEVVIAGAAGTGKTRGVLEMLHERLATTAGARALMIRKTYASLKATAMITFDEQVHPEWDGVVFHGDTRKRPPHYAYPNGSTLVVGGLDKPEKIMSSEYDLIYVAECTDLNLNEWESLVSRTNRPGRPRPLGYAQVLGDCNPQQPTHWLKERAEAGQCVMFTSVHEDNPAIYDADAQAYTSDGLSYLATLDRLTGVRYLRLRKGVWAAAEGMIYADCYDERRNLVERASISTKPHTLYGDCGIDPSWPRYMAIDFGFTHAFVCKWYALDGDGRAYMYRELYMTHRLVEDHAKTIREYAQWGKTNGDPLPRRIYADHDAEDRATLEKHLGMRTTPAEKAVKAGIDAVMSRWRPAGDGKPRLYYLRDSLIERDQWLASIHEPTCSREEIEAYVWQDNATKDAPVKERDHGMDCDRYLVAGLDLKPGGAKLGPRLF